MTGSNQPPRPHRPALRAVLPEELTPLSADPAVDLHDAIARGETTARAVVAAGHEGSVDVERLVALGDEVGLDELAGLWARAEAGTLPAALFALYVLRAWCRQRPDVAARLVSAGRVHADVAAAVAGVPAHADGADVVRVCDDLLRGALARDLPTSLSRAAALCRVLAAGRGSGPEDAPDTWSQAVLGARLLSTADSLDAAAGSA
ncbi:MAG: hypothetical protein ACTHOD_20050 [Motilibacteraceae bacterium]